MSVCTNVLVNKNARVLKHKHIHINILKVYSLCRVKYLVSKVHFMQLVSPLKEKTLNVLNATFPFYILFNSNYIL